MTPQEKIAAAYRLALEEGLEDKTEVLENFMEEVEEYHVRETDKAGSNMVRKRSMRPIRSARQQQRA
jgi:hypothetical protein